MKLYYSPAACSLAPHIALAESGLPHETIKVDLRKHTLHDGTSFYDIHAKGYVYVTLRVNVVEAGAVGQRVLAQVHLDRFMRQAAFGERDVRGERAGGGRVIKFHECLRMKGLSI